MTISLDSNAEKTLVLYGSENAIRVIKQFYSRVQNVSNLYVDASGPQAIIQVREYNEILHDLVRRGVKRRLVTEITKENVAYCKQLMGFVDLRHLEGIKGNFAVSETEYMATAVLYKTEPVTQVIYSNAKAIIEQHQYLFDTLWNKASPGEKIIQEIEDGIEPERTDVVQGAEAVGRVIFQFLQNAKQSIQIIADSFDLELAVSHFLETLKQVTGRGIKIRYLTEITPQNIESCKIISKYVDEVRHLDGLKGNFSINEIECISSPVSLQKQKVPQVFYSNAKSVVEQNRFLFETLGKIHSGGSQIQRDRRRHRAHTYQDS